MKPILHGRTSASAKNYFADLALSGRFSSIAKNYTPEELRTATPELTNIGSYEKMLAAAGRPLGHGEERNAGRTFFRDFHGGARQAPGFDMAEYALDGAYVVSKDFTEGRLNF